MIREKKRSGLSIKLEVTMENQFDAKKIETTSTVHGSGVERFNIRGSWFFWESFSFLFSSVEIGPVTTRIIDSFVSATAIQPRPSFVNRESWASGEGGASTRWTAETPNKNGSRAIRTTLKEDEKQHEWMKWMVMLLLAPADSRPWCPSTCWSAALHATTSRPSTASPKTSTVGETLLFISLLLKTFLFFFGERENLSRDSWW